MKANSAQMARVLDAPAPDVRVYLLYGPDEAGSAALLARLVRAMGDGAERIDLDLATLKADPARLSDEAAAMGLFGDKRYIVLRWEGREDPTSAVADLLEATVAGNPVVIIGGALKSSAAIVKLVTAHKAGLVCASYLPNARELEQIAGAIAREQGLRLAGDVAQRIVRMASGDRALMAREIEKLALYLDAAPDRPTEADSLALDAISAESGETDQRELVKAVLSGRPDQVAHELARLKGEGANAIALLRAVHRRMQTLARLHAQSPGGRGLEQAVASLPIWEKDAAMPQLRKWPPAAIATLNARLLEAERGIKSAGSAGDVIAETMLVSAARAAARG